MYQQLFCCIANTGLLCFGIDNNINYGLFAYIFKNTIYINMTVANSSLNYGNF